MNADIGYAGAAEKSDCAGDSAKGERGDRGERDCDDGDVTERDGCDRERREDRGEWNGGEVGGESMVVARWK